MKHRGEVVWYINSVYKWTHEKGTPGVVLTATICATL